MWELVVIFGITWAGAGGERHSQMPDKETCIMALNQMKINTNGHLATVSDADVVIAYCKPMTK